MIKENRSPILFKDNINYIFFGVYFVVISFIHVLHVALIEPVFSLSGCFFTIYALAQCFLETLLLIMGSTIIKRWFPKMLNVYVIFVFFLFLSHLIDFPLVRLMDMSFWFALHFISQESYENFIELLLASNVSLIVWMIAALGGVLLLLSGLFLFRLTERMARLKPLVLSLPILCAVLCCMGLFLFSWDFSVRKHVSVAFFDRYQKTLPWKNTLFPHKIEFISLRSSLPEMASEEEVMQKLDSRLFSLQHKPDIYLFIVESLREDFITPEIAPRLSQFRDEHLSFPIALSNANATHISWFSLFHSQFPFYWGSINPDQNTKGSLPLILLKKMGYKIHVCSSARLSYYKMDRIIFGESEYLADSLFVPDDDETVEPYQRDLNAMDHLNQQMKQADSGRVFIVFLDATHLDYSWPQEMSKFTPFEKKINYFKVSMLRNELEGLKNRYRNSLYFVDSLFEKFFNTLDTLPKGKESIVIVTGDHGEEFYEHGNLFHASNLSHPQMHVPLYYQFGEFVLKDKNNLCHMTCHMDIFPSIFHYLTGEDLMEKVLQGESIFKTKRWPYTVVARFNASRSPYHFCIHDGNQKLIAEFSDEKNIFNSKKLHIIGCKNCKDENLMEYMDTLPSTFGPALERFFSIQ